MRKTIFILSLVLINSSQMFSQDFKIGYQHGMGQYLMSDLKTLNEGIAQNLPFESKLVDDFPMYWYFRPFLAMSFDEFELGLVYTFQSTGSRISAKDYSGEYRMDMQVMAHSAGFSFDYSVFEKNKINLSIYSITGVNFSNLNMSEYLYVQDSTLLDYQLFAKSINYFVEPGLKISYRLRFFEFALNIGYAIQFGDQVFYTHNDKNYILTHPNSSAPIKPDWSGLRIGLSVCLKFKWTKEIEDQQ